MGISFMRLLIALGRLTVNSRRRAHLLDRASYLASRFEAPTPSHFPDFRL
jgi:hypothetical protein